MGTAEPSVQEENKALVRRYLEEIYRGNYDILDEVISPEYFADRPPRPDGLAAGARYKAQFIEIHRAFPDMQIVFDALIAERDLVAFQVSSLEPPYSADRQAGDLEGQRLQARSRRQAGRRLRHLELAQRPRAAGSHGHRGADHVRDACCATSASLNDCQSSGCTELPPPFLAASPGSHQN
jgi:predicted SnoaL-like aldol condensation-catalyzing enzyme